MPVKIRLISFCCQFKQEPRERKSHRGEDGGKEEEEILGAFQTCVLLFYSFESLEHLWQKTYRFGSGQRSRSSCSFTNKRSCFLLTAVGHLYTRLSPVSFWGWQRQGQRWGGRGRGGGRWETNRRFGISVIRFFGSGLKNDGDDGCMERKTIHLSHAHILMSR